MTRLLRTARTARARLADWRTWLHGLIGAIIGGGANAIVVMVVDPAGFNFAEGFTKLWQFTALSALVSGALYLKQTPLPPLSPEPLTAADVALASRPPTPINTGTGINPPV